MEVRFACVFTLLPKKRARRLSEHILKRLFISSIQDNAFHPHITISWNERGISLVADHNLISLFSNLEICSRNWNLFLLCCTSRSCVVILRCNATSTVWDIAPLHCTSSNTVQIAVVLDCRASVLYSGVHASLLRTYYFS